MLARCLLLGVAQPILGSSVTRLCSGNLEGLVKEVDRSRVYKNVCIVDALHSLLIKRVPRSSCRFVLCNLNRFSMLSMTREAKPGSWQTVKKKEINKKEKPEEKKDRDRLGVKVADAFADFDKAFAQQAAAAQQEQRRTQYQGAFANLEDEPSARDHQEADDEGSSGEDTAPVGVSNGGKAAIQTKPKAPKQPRKPKVTVAQVAEGLDVSSLQLWMAEVQLRYSTNETAQLEALSDRLLSVFKEAHFDLAKLLATKGIHTATAQPVSEVPNALMNALASFVAAVSEASLVQMTIPLTLAVINEAAGGNSGAAPVGKGKAGLQIMLAVILRTRPQVLVQAASELRKAGRQLTGGNRMPLLLWVINQAATADPAVGVAVWVRLLLPQLLGLLELPSTTAKSTSTAAGNKSGNLPAAGLADDLLRPLEAPLQGPAIEYLAQLLKQLQVSKGSAAVGGDVTRGDGEVEPTVPGSAVELLSRLVADKPLTPPPAEASKGGAAATAAATDSKKAASARAAAASALAPHLPGLTALAASTSSRQQYSEWLVLALESAALSSADPQSPDALVERSASNVVACLCGSDACFNLWEAKHKGHLRGSARILAAMLQHPKLLEPLQQQAAVGPFRELLAALPARHRTHLAAGKGWQGACARTAEDACNKLQKRVGGRGWASSKGSSTSTRGGIGLFPILGATSVLAGCVIMSGLYRHEVAGIVQAYAGLPAAQELDRQVLQPLESVIKQAVPYVEQAEQLLEPVIAKVQETAVPMVAQAWHAVEPTAVKMQEHVVAPALAGVQQLWTYASEQLQEIVAHAKSQ